jgi:hypothetical protein
LPDFLKPGNQGLEIDPSQRGEARETDSAGLAGFDMRPLLLSSVAQAPRWPAFRITSFISVMAVGKLRETKPSSFLFAAGQLLNGKVSQIADFQ